MKTRRISLIWTIALLFGLVSFAIADGETPPDIEKGWNLISTPCDVTLDQLKQKLGNDEILVFDWNGSEYISVTELERGRGYMLNSPSVLSTSSVCKGETPLPEDFSKTFRQGWNLIGNPFHKAVTFSSILGDSASFITYIYEYQGNKIRRVDVTDHAKVWGGYWIYAAVPVTITYQEPSGESRCDSLTVALASGGTDMPDVFVGDTLALAAICTKDGVASDVTAGSQWTSSQQGILAETQTAGTYTAAAVGETTVTATYFTSEGNAAVVVKNNPVVTLESLKFVVDSDAITLGSSTQIQVIARYSNDTHRDVTGEVEYTVANPDIGEIIVSPVDCLTESKTDCVGGDTAHFFGQAPGQTVVYATLGEIKSNEITVTVKGDEVASLIISSPKTVLEPHETVLLQAAAVYESGKIEDVTLIAEWTITPEGIGTIQQSTGRFSPLNLGTALISAEYSGVTSNQLQITIQPKTLRWLTIYNYPGESLAVKLPCPSDPKPKWCYTHYAIRIGASTNLYTYGEYYDDRTYWLSPSSVSWEVSDPSILSVTNSGVITALSAGIAGLRVYKDGVYSEWFWFYVYGNTPAEFVLLEYSNEETIVEKDKEININATRYFFDASTSSFTSSNVTGSAEWSLSTPARGTISQGIFKGLETGDTTVTATFNGHANLNPTTLRVWQPSHLTYCDQNNINDISWHDGLTVANLESDCKTYTQQDTVKVRFLAELSQPTDRRVLDVCLDLYIYDSNQNLVRTFQHRNCSPTSLFRAHEGYVPVYDYTAEWDQKDDSGNKVPAGEYTAVARYYILYCPVLKVKFSIQ